MKLFNKRPNQFRALDIICYVKYTEPSAQDNYIGEKTHLFLE